MWKIDKPKLNRAKNKDVRELIANCDELEETDKQSIKQLYQQYDDQNGDVTDAQLSVIPEVKAEAIYKMYKKTYEDKPLAYIRNELTEKVYKCPYCSINQPDTLDHYMPESQYKALAVCRMNLVPMCGVCNNFKKTKPYKKFIKCYYDEFPTERPFLVANVFTIRNRFVVKFKFDETSITDADLMKKLVYQENETRLFKRIVKASSVFITTLCLSCEQNDTVSLKAWLKRILSVYETEYGKNDWRCAVVRGMLEYQRLDITQIKYNKLNPRRINAGVV